MQRLGLSKFNPHLHHCRPQTKPETVQCCIISSSQSIFTDWKLRSVTFFVAPMATTNQVRFLGPIRRGCQRPKSRGADFRQEACLDRTSVNHQG